MQTNKVLPAKEGQQKQQEQQQDYFNKMSYELDYDANILPASEVCANSWRTNNTVFRIIYIQKLIGNL